MASRRNAPPPLLALNAPPPLLSIDDTIGLPPLIEIGTVLPALIDDPRTVQMNEADWTVRNYQEENKRLREKLSAQSDKLAKVHKIEKYVGGLAKVAINYAEQKIAEIEAGAVDPEDMKRMNEVIHSVTREVNGIQMEALPRDLKTRLATAAKEKAHLELELLQKKEGLTPAIKQLFIAMINKIQTYGLNGLYKIGEVVLMHKKPIAAVTDKTYDTAYYMATTFLFGLLSSLLMFIINPETYVLFIEKMYNVTGTGNARITEILGGRRARKTRKQSKHKHSKTCKHKRKHKHSKTCKHK